MHKLLNPLHYIILGFALLVGAQTALADTVQNPVTMIQNTVGKLQTEIAQQKDALAQNPQQLYQLVKTVVMPDVDVNQMAAMTLGPKWRSATPAEKQEFIDKFGLLLTKTYTNALLTVTDYTVVVYPMRGNDWQTEQNVSVSGTVTPKNGGQSSAVTYYLERSGNSWKIYDMAVEGVSFMKNFQSQFQSFANMQDLLARLTQLNNSQS
ncbi:MAG: toluene tolerance, Ttg2 family protein [Gammaproteobacteria bacterium]|jgi:phospholipid transport system substrate-binding protein|nr:toluene tolerance, Ttg2 family protein [Gammaproteobacteria bacterium]